MAIFPISSSHRFIKKCRNESEIEQCVRLDSEQLTNTRDFSRTA
jgi:hypothetical protein